MSFSPLSPRTLFKEEPNHTRSLAERKSDKILLVDSYLVPNFPAGNSRRLIQQPLHYRTRIPSSHSFVASPTNPHLHRPSEMTGHARIVQRAGVSGWNEPSSRGTMSARPSGLSRPSGPRSEPYEAPSLAYRFAPVPQRREGRESM
jgi:hypothetical protein